MLGFAAAPGKLRGFLRLLFSPPPPLPPAHQAGTNLCTHATPRIHDRTRENRRMHVLSDAVTRTRNMHTQCSRVVSTLPFG